MAVTETDDDLRKKLLGAPQGSAPGFLGIGGAPTETGTKASAAPAAPQGGAPTSSGMYNGLYDFLNLNQGQGTQMAQGLAGDVSKQAQSAQGAVDQLAQQFPGQANAAAAGPAGTTVPKSIADLQGYGKVAGQVQDAQQQVNALGSQGGLQYLLQQKYANRENYGPGQSNYDAFLAGGTTGGRAALAGPQAMYGGLKDYLGYQVDKSSQYQPPTNASTSGSGGGPKPGGGGWHAPGQGGGVITNAPRPHGAYVGSDQDVDPYTGQPKKERTQKNVSGSRYGGGY